MWKLEPLPQPSSIEAKPLPWMLDPMLGSWLVVCGAEGEVAGGIAGLRIVEPVVPVFGAGLDVVRRPSILVTEPENWCTPSCRSIFQ